MRILLDVLALFIVLATILPLIRHSDWWIRVFDFPRAQILVLGVVILLLMAFLGSARSGFDHAAMVLAVAAVAYQAARMLPYTVVWPKQVSSARPDVSEGNALSIVIANVLMTNRRYDAFRALLADVDPDVILAVETDQWWADRLSTLGADYPHAIELPLDNTYGMVLRSRLPLHETEVRFLVQDDVPGIRTTVELPSGQRVTLFGVHPRPPAPNEATSSVPRDAEILLVGREVREIDGPAIVMGDLNDVAWSHTTRLFQRISGLLDPRRGRGMFNTYHADIPMMRWPLDHIFHSVHFSLIDIRRMPRWGSDHFAVFAHLHLSTHALLSQEEVEEEPEDVEAAATKIKRAK